MAEEARARGETLQGALGVPPEEFCRGVLENVRHTGWAGRALQALRRTAAMLFSLFLLAPVYWLMEYDGFLLYQELTGESLGLQGRWVMFLPVWLAAALAVLTVVLELWNQLAEGKLAGRKWGQAVSIGFYLLALGIFLFGIHGGPSEGPLGGGALLAMDLRVAVPVYLAVLLALELGYRLYISRISRDYNWRE